MQKRERRRKDLWRMKAKARRLQRRWGGNNSKLYDHLAWCSGPCCGNQRRWADSQKAALTIQERRAAIGRMVARSQELDLP